MNKIFFVTSVGGDIGSSVARHIKEEYKNDMVLGCDIEEYNQGLDYVSECLIAPRYTDETNYWKFVMDVCRDKKITHFLPMSEQEMLIADQHRDFFDDYNIKLLLLPHDVLEITFSKYRTAIYLKKHNVKVPKTWKVGYEGEYEFPLIVKGDRGCGSKMVRVVNSEVEFQQALKEIPQPVVQAYVGSDEEEYTMAVFSDGEHIETIAFRRKLGYGGMSVYVEYVEEAGLVLIAKDIVRALRLIGSVNVQLRKQNEVFYVIEINPRISSTIGFRYRLGFKDDIWWIHLLDDEEVDISYSAPNGPIVGIKVLDERIYRPGIGGGGCFALIPARISDCDLLLEWTNEEECRKNSFCKHVISKPEHMKWFYDIYRSDKKNIFILMDGDFPIAQVREEIVEKEIWLSYSVIRERRGCGFGKLLLQMYEYMRTDLINNGYYLYGIVKRANVASQRVFEELGYKKEEDERGYIYYKNNTCTSYDVKISAMYSLSADARSDIGGGGVILLSNNRNSFGLYQWLKEQGECVCYYSGKITKEQILFLKPSLVISYNYGYIIPAELIRLIEDKIINMHISYLPWNRGADPNFWSFIENTPKGVTIHRLSAEVDHGDILLQRRMFFEEKEETFMSTYETLNLEIVKLLQEHWLEIKYKYTTPRPQVGRGSSHIHREFLEFVKGKSFDWQEVIHDFKKRIMVRQ